MTRRTQMAVIALISVACGRTDPLPFVHRSFDAGGGRCGDGILDPFEDCDDANDREDDACRLTCDLARCGDGIVWLNVEFCDDGNTMSSDGCRADCAPPRCGDGFIDRDEDCDDANADNTDNCLSTCRRPFCGDRFVRSGIEQCDDGNMISTDACVDCVAARCGDGFVFRGVEACDDANMINNDGCSNVCAAPRCGDGIVAGNEQCDLGGGNRDAFAFEISQPNGFSQGVAPDRSSVEVVELYSYSSASAHTGLERLQESIAFLHAAPFSRTISLFLIHGIDSGLAPEPQPDSSVNMRIFGLPRGWFVAVADDQPRELFGVSDSEAQARWRFDDNTDGGVIDGLPFLDPWQITIEPDFVSGIDRWVFIDGGGQRIPLNRRQSLQIRQNIEPSQCRTDCTIPRCGDGKLDAGELCPNGF